MPGARYTLAKKKKKSAKTQNNEQGERIDATRFMRIMRAIDGKIIWIDPEDVLRKDLAGATRDHIAVYRLTYKDGSMIDIIEMR